GGRSLVASTVWGLSAAMVFSPAIVLLPPILIAAFGVSRSPGTGAVVVDAAARRRRFLVAGGVLLIVFVAGIWLWQVLLGPALHGGVAGLGFANLGELSPAAVGYTAVAMATGYTLGPGPIEWHAQPPVMPSPGEAVLMGGGVLILAALWLRGLDVVRRTVSVRAAALLLALSVIPVMALAAAAVWTGHRFAPRHAGVIALPVLLLAAAGTLPSGRRAAWPAVAGALLLVLQAVSLGQLHLSPRYLREQVRDAADYVDRVAHPDDLVLVFGGIDLPWRWYDHGGVPSRIVYPDDPATWSPGSMPAVLEGHPRVVVVRGEIMFDPLEKPLYDAVTSMGRRESAMRFPGLEVEVLSLVTQGESP
ncbi:MAG TPA: hypothetical protein VMQ62_07235, partial [Dongiaceae bacterium]|nr:hypothetical protein [Dongiaceae bacterium]